MEVSRPGINNGPQGLERSFAEIPAEDTTDAIVARPIRRRCSSSPLGWPDLLKSDRVLIISQAGSGKTYECETQQRRLWAEGEPAFMLELADLAAHNLEDQLSPEEEQRLQQWRLSQADVATFFLDSIDELKLTQGSFRTALKRLAKAIGGQLARARVVITSRPVPFERELLGALLPVPPKPEGRLTAGEFADVAMGKAKRKDETDDQAIQTRTVELLPLSDEQVVLFASDQGVGDPDVFLANIHRRNATEFAERPQDLIEFCAEWRERHHISSHRAQVASAIATKLRPRTDRRERAELSPDRAYEGAGRLALAAMLMRRLTFRHGPEAEVGGLPGTAIDPADILYDWTAEERRTLLERALFGFASYGRVRFQHRSVMEYLAARRLIHHLASGKPIGAVKRLLFTETAQGEKVVRPAMRPVAAWLALDSDSIFAEIIDRDPAVTLDFGDPDALSDGQKAQALRAYVARHGRGGWRGLQVPAIQVRRFATPGLALLVRELWPTVENPEVRELLLDLIGAARMDACVDLAAEAALSSEEAFRIRISALDALIEMCDPLLQDVARSIETDASTWPVEIARAAVVRLFPGHIRVESLLNVLARLTDKRHSAGYLTYHLPERIAGMDRGPDLDTLVRGLSALVADGVAWTGEWPHYKSHRAFLLQALTAACSRRMSAGPFVPDLAEAVAVALRLAEHSDEADHHVKALREQVARLEADSRAMLFWTEDGFRQSQHPKSDHFSRLWEAARHGPIRLDAKRDAVWLHAALRDTKRPIAERAMMLDAVLRHVWEGQGTWDEHVQRVRAEVADSAVLVAMADRLLTPVMPDPGHVAMEASWKEREAKQIEQQAKDHESWGRFWGELASNAEMAFASKRSDATVWNLWQVMSQSGQESRSSGWNRRFLEAHFGPVLADRMRDAFRPVWRQDRPTLWSEREPGKRNTYLTRWQLGLVAIAAEAEDRAWATKLTADEARLACRYAPIQLNGLPSWLDDVTMTQPAEVQEVLGNELAIQLRAPASIEGSGLLTSIGYSSASLKDLFRPRLLAWLDERGDIASEDDNKTASVARLDAVLDILVRDSDAARQRVQECALGRLGEGTMSSASSAATMWLSVLLRIDPKAGTAALERLVGGLAPAKQGRAIELFAALFGDRYSARSIFTSEASFSPQLLLRLVTLAYQHVRVADDDQHEGAYTPDARDHAQHARNALLDALLRTKGPDGWTAKLALAEQPWFVYMRDRTLSIARELAAEEADGQPATAAAVVSLERYGETPPATHDDMFQLMEDRLADFDDLLLQDTSPRELLAGVKEEQLVRRAVAYQLRTTANGTYTVDQEAVTADEKETDVRLRSTTSEQEGVIEIKIGEKDRSAADLRRALSDQLVHKYMAAESCRAGVLLITTASDRRWEHPDTGEMIEFVGLIAMLNEEARRIVDNFRGNLRISARGFDFRARLPPERVMGAVKKIERPLADQRGKQMRKRSAKNVVAVRPSGSSGAL